MAAITQPRSVTAWTGMRYGSFAGHTTVPDFMHGVLKTRLYLVGDVKVASYLAGDVKAETHLLGKVELNK